MFNKEVPHKTSADVLNGNSQIASYFAAVDNAVSIGDTNKRYQPVNNTSYGPPPPIHGNTFTTVIISPTADNTADIYNGYIRAKMKIRVTHTDANIKAWEDNAQLERKLTNPHKVWVGFKDAMDAIEKYEIMANGISIYTQNNAIEESYITACAMPDTVRKTNSFSHVTHKDVFMNKFSNGCGAYVDLAGVTQGTAIEAEIPLKIDLRRFLPLSNIKFLPAFAGKIELRILFGTAGLVCAPVSPIACFKNPQYVSMFDISSVTNEFVPIGEKVTVISHYTAPTQTSATAPPTKYGELYSTQLTMSATIDQITECESIINCFGIASDVYDELVQHYCQTPLTFPTQTLSFAPLANTLNKKGNGSSSITLTPRFVDSLFLLFPLKQRHRTCYKNPHLTQMQIQCGGYGSLPGIAHGTDINGAAQTIEELQNALNLNGDLVGLNKDVVRSMVEAKFKSSLYFKTGHESRNGTDFLVGFATETDNTFQQGQTSNTPITYTFTYQQNVVTKEGAEISYYNDVEVPPILGVLVDSTFSIQIRPDGAPPIVEIGAYDITSPVMM